MIRHFVKPLILYFVFCIPVSGIVSCGNTSSENNAKIKDGASTKPEASEVSLLESQLRKDSLNNVLRIRLATTYYSMKDFNAAFFHFSKANKIDPKNLTVLINLGNICYDTRQNEQALEFYEKALEIDSKNINVRCDMATCCFNLKKTDKAINILKENTKMDMNHAQTHYNLYVIYSQTGNKKGADEELVIFNNLKK